MPNRPARLRAACALLAGACVLAACGHTSAPSAPRNTLPSFVAGTPKTITYDGTTDDLLTGGLGKSGLGSGTAPAIANATAPTAAELRRVAIYNNYRALVDISAGGGYGSLYGPNVDASGNVTSGTGMIAGDETLAYSDDGTGKINVTMMVQLPATFDKANPCIVSASSSGSRGVYGAIGTAGEWGLKRGCAIAYTDKGTGNGAHDLGNNTVNLIDGTRLDATAAGKASNFTAPLSAGDLAAFNAASPNRFAFKHAHSQQNPEKDWGQFTLQAIQLAFWAINEKYGDLDPDGVHHLQTFQPGKVIVIASSVSNGAGAALAAAEQDAGGLISGVVAGEPQVQIPPTASVAIQRGATPVSGSGKTLYDYVTLANLYQPCASLSAMLVNAAGMPAADATKGANRCATLAAKGYLLSATTSTQADEALQKLRMAGYEAESDALHGAMYLFANTAIAVTYANAYARASVKDGLCGFSFAATDPMTFVPAALAAASEAKIFGTGNGIPPVSGINLVNDKNGSGAGPFLDANSTSSSSGTVDYNADGADCLRQLQTGKDGTGAALTGALLASSQAVQSGVGQVLRNGNLRGKPAILVQGRNDTLVPGNHASRAYFGFNQKTEGSASRLVYYEVANAQHFDAFITLFAAFQTRYVPLHRYFIQAMDLMYANLKNGVPLPRSQVVRTTPRISSTGTVAPLAPSNVPPIPATPASTDAITFSSGTVNVPD